MDYWILISVRAKKMDGTTVFKDDLLITYGLGLKAAVAGLRQNIAGILNRAWNACTKAELDERAKLGLSDNKTTTIS